MATAFRSKRRIFNNAGYNCILSSDEVVSRAKFYLNTQTFQFTSVVSLVLEPKQSRINVYPTLANPIWVGRYFQLEKRGLSGCGETDSPFTFYETVSDILADLADHETEIQRLKTNYELSLAGKLKELDKFTSAVLKMQTDYPEYYI